MLIAKGDAPDEFRMHLAGALRLGWKKGEMLELMLQAAPFASFPNALNAVKWSSEVFEAADAGALSPSEDLVRRVFAADAGRDVDAFLALLAPDATFRMGSGPELGSTRAMRTAVQTLFDSVQSIQHRLIQLWVNADSIAVRAEVMMTLKNGPVSRTARVREGCSRWRQLPSDSPQTARIITLLPRTRSGSVPAGKPLAYLGKSHSL